MTTTAWTRYVAFSCCLRSSWSLVRGNLESRTYELPTCKCINEAHSSIAFAAGLSFLVGRGCVWTRPLRPTNYFDTRYCYASRDIVAITLASGITTYLHSKVLYIPHPLLQLPPLIWLFLHDVHALRYPVLQPFTRYTIPCSLYCMVAVVMRFISLRHYTVVCAFYQLF